MRWGATRVVFGALLVGGVLSPVDIERAFDLDEQLVHVAHIFNRVFQEATA